MTSVKTKYRVALFVLGTLMLCNAEMAEESQYEIPQPKFKLLKPKGFQVSIPDEHGIKLFAFHGNLNKKMEKMGTGQFSMDVIEKQNGKWIYQNRKLKVRAGDVIYFWTFVIKNAKGYTRDNDLYEVSESDVNRISKKVHKLRKRYVHSPYHSHSEGTHTYGAGFNQYQYKVGALASGGFDDTEDRPVGNSYGHGSPHHHRRGYHGHGYGHGHGHGHNHGYRGGHTPEFHGGSWPLDTQRYGGYHGQRFHGHGHGPYFGHSDHFHSGHHHDDDCHWSDSSEENKSEVTEEKTDETSTAVQPSVESVDIEPRDKDVTSTTGRDPEPEAEIIETTPAIPQIDIRIGTKTK